MTQRFEYSFQSHYATVDGIRIHDLDEGQGPVILSDGDMAWKPDEGARIAQLVPDGQFYLVHRAGHFLQEDAGTEVAEQMIQFLRSHNIGKSSAACIRPVGQGQAGRSGIRTCRAGGFMQ